jgi:ribitol-5-phosphate 2-dehydrogenase (NADP+) / D-ribitol-5-phosphate cytidylyltransferase
MEFQKKNDHGYSAILLMGGLGTRFGSSLPKQFHRIAGKPIYQYTLEKFLEIPDFLEILLVAPKNWIEDIKKQICIYESPKIQIVEGGETRQQSSYRGLLACDPNTDFVVIHDAVRPFVSKQILLRNLEEVKLHHAVDTCIPSADTLVHSLDDGFIQSIPPRKEFRRGQTPQSFSYRLIMQAHQYAQRSKPLDHSDDCSLVLGLGHPVRIVEGDEKNIKITTELDLFIAEQMMRLPSTEQTVSSNIKLDLQGKIYAITGGTGDIGKALCQELEQAGARTILLSTSSSHSVDLTQFEEVKNRFQQIYKEHGALDGLINSVGSFSVKNFFDLTSSDIENTIATNLVSVIYSCQCAKIKTGGHIVNISSSSYTKGRKDYLIYSSAKAAVVNFTQGLAEALPDIQVNVVVPQRTDSKMRRAHFPNEPLDSLLTPREVAQKIIHLLKETVTTGSIIEIRKSL